MKHRILSMLLLVAMLISLSPVQAFAVDTTASGDCGEGVTWSLDSTGTLTISGTGEMADYTNDDSVPWANYRAKIKSVQIADGVTKIGEKAFRWCKAVESVKIPDTVTVIQECAFDGCNKLEDVYYDGSIKQWSDITIGERNDCLNNASKHFTTLQLTLDRESVSMKAGDKAVTVTATVTHSECADLVTWSVENPDGKEIISVKDGTITPNSNGLGGTAYAVAKIEYDGEIVASVRCRIDVTADSKAADKTDGEKTDGDKTAANKTAAKKTVANKTAAGAKALSPATGDNTSIAFTAMMMAAAIGIMTVVSRKKKRG